MTKTLQQHKKQELIKIIQDFQECISEIERELNVVKSQLLNQVKPSRKLSKLKMVFVRIQASLNRWVHKEV